MGYRKFSEIIGDIGPERRARIDALKEAIGGSLSPGRRLDGPMQPRRR